MKDSHADIDAVNAAKRGENQKESTIKLIKQPEAVPSCVPEPEQKRARATIEPLDPIDPREQSKKLLDAVPNLTRLATTEAEKTEAIKNFKKTQVDDDDDDSGHRPHICIALEEALEEEYPELFNINTRRPSAQDVVGNHGPAKDIDAVVKLTTGKLLQELNKDRGLFVGSG